MAAKAQTEAASGWWGGFVTMVKAQADVVTSVLKEDLQEFTSTISHDTKEAVEKVKQSEDGIATQITSGLTGLMGLSKDKNKSGHDANVIAADRQQSRLLSLQNEMSTFAADPSDRADYEAWLQSFQISEHTDEISRLLTGNEKMREIHTKLVPLAVTYNDFWNRYYYKAHKLEQEEARRVALMSRAAASTSVDEMAIGWDDEFDDFEAPTSNSGVSAAVAKGVPKKDGDEDDKEDDSISPEEAALPIDGDTAVPVNPTPAPADLSALESAVASHDLSNTSTPSEAATASESTKSAEGTPFDPSAGTLVATKEKTSVVQSESAGAPNIEESTTETSATPAISAESSKVPSSPGQTTKQQPAKQTADTPNEQGEDWDSWE